MPPSKSIPDKLNYCCSPSPSIRTCYSVCLEHSPRPVFTWLISFLVSELSWEINASEKLVMFPSTFYPPPSNSPVGICNGSLSCFFCYSAALEHTHVRTHTPHTLWLGNVLPYSNLIGYSPSLTNWAHPSETLSRKSGTWGRRFVQTLFPAEADSRSIWGSGHRKREFWCPAPRASGMCCHLWSGAGTFPHCGLGAVWWTRLVLCRPPLTHSFPQFFLCWKSCFQLRTLNETVRPPLCPYSPRTSPSLHVISCSIWLSVLLFVPSISSGLGQ